MHKHSLCWGLVLGLMAEMVMTGTAHAAGALSQSFRPVDSPVAVFPCSALLREINQDYAALHHAREVAFWGDRMNLSSYRPGTYEEEDARFQAFVGNNPFLSSIDAALAQSDLHPEDRAGLERTRTILSLVKLKNPASSGIQEELLRRNATLSKTQQELQVRFADPTQAGRETALSMGEAGELLASEPNMERRQALYAGILQFHNHMLRNTDFLEIVKLRNRLARSEGYENYFDMNVRQKEGVTLKELFVILDDLELKTRAAQERLVAELRVEKTDAVRKPWNWKFMTQGDLTAELDPYFPLEDALMRLGKTFTGLGIRFGFNPSEQSRPTQITLDLINREGKYQNGFMHAPAPAYFEGGRLNAAQIGVATTANPAVVGTGYALLGTLLHEFGHAAHFSGARGFTPLDGQEHMGSSIAAAELQAMFVDSLTKDPLWLWRYARTSEGQRLSRDLIYSKIIQSARLEVMELRRMLSVSYFEKMLYEMPEAELTSDRVEHEIGKIIERLLMIQGHPRPFLFMVHPIGAETSAYYHNYTLAQMGVYQTQAFFEERDGHITDNPRVGTDLARAFWAPGNGRGFFEMIPALTGQPFSAAATAQTLSKTPEDIRREIDRALDQLDSSVPQNDGPVGLEARIRIIHGDEEIGVTGPGKSFEELAEDFSVWLKRTNAGRQ